MMNNKHLTIDIIRTLESLLHKEYQLENVIVNRLGFTPKQEEEIRNKILTLIKTL